MNKGDFPIFADKSDLVYLDSASTAQKPKCVIDAVAHFYSFENANIHRGLYSLSEKATLKFDEVREKVANFIGASSSEIVFTRGATESINLVAYSWGLENLGARDTVLVSVMEHHSNFVPWQQICKQTGAEFRVVGLNLDGYVSASDMINAMDETVKLVCVTQLSNSLGVAVDVGAVCEAASKFGARVLVDVAQSVVHMPIDVASMGCDFLAFSGHKLYGPMGIGVLYIKDGLIDSMKPFNYGGDMIKSVSIEETLFASGVDMFEAGTPHVAGVIGLGAAIDYVSGIGMDKISEHDRELCEYAFERLSELDFVRVVSPASAQSAISFVVDGVHSHDVSQILADHGVCVRGGHHCTQSLNDALGVAATTRLSFGVYNEKEDVDKAVEALNEVKKIFG